MIRSATEIRQATAEEIGPAIAAIVAAFLTDPVTRLAWPLPDESHEHASQAGQDRHLDTVLAWVDAYGGPKVSFATVPSSVEIALLAEAPPS
jgi:hypothetical protein